MNKAEVDDDFLALSDEDQAEVNATVDEATSGVPKVVNENKDNPLVDADAEEAKAEEEGGEEEKKEDGEA